MISEIKKESEKDNLIIGYERVNKALTSGKLTKVFYASNIDAGRKAELEKYAKIAKVPLEDAGIPNDELGIICKKSFSISVLAIK